MQPGPGITPDYEVRLQLNPSTVLNRDDHELKGPVATAFKAQSAINLHIQFLDTDLKDIYNATWSTRIRKIENKKHFELTYKKRYPVAGDDVDLAITTARLDGFDGNNTNYETQLEWGYKTRTLSITHKQKVDTTTRGMDLPGLGDSRQMLIDKAPDRFNDWKDNKGWGISALQKSRIFGPVLVRRYIGIWHDLELDVEIWPLRDAVGSIEVEYIVQASFKTASYSTACDEQSKLAEYLRSKDWFLPKDSLMTQLIMERY